MTFRMRTTLITLGVLFATAIASGVAGWHVGVDSAAGFFADGYMLRNTTDVRTQVAVLQSLRNGQTEKATELLEAYLDGNIIGLSTRNSFSNRTNAAVAEAIQKTKDYRSNYPRHTSIQEIDMGVDRVLQNTPIKESQP
ncbi:MAG: hypothetical protein EPO06_09020 [Burkholderiaceae bacterium]|nr:MAG: hypothetical protein EPO06_09020 [Burkholderiaceae bacterium]